MYFSFGWYTRGEAQGWRMGVWSNDEYESVEHRVVVNEKKQQKFTPIAGYNWFLDIVLHLFHVYYLTRERTDLMLVGGFRFMRLWSSISCLDCLSSLDFEGHLNSYNTHLKGGNSLGRPMTIVARGHAHSIHGQAQAQNRVVIEMGSLKGIYFHNSLAPYMDVSGGESWIDVLHTTLKEGMSPRCQQAINIQHDRRSFLVHNVGKLFIYGTGVSEFMDYHNTGVGQRGDVEHKI
eukprot:Gb_31931 [translate_table: standard]